MNFTPQQIAKRNLFAAITGVSEPEIVEAAIAFPSVSETLDPILNQLFTGPFGTIGEERFVLDHVRHVLAGAQDTMEPVTREEEGLDDGAVRGWRLGYPRAAGVPDSRAHREPPPRVGA